MWNTACCATRRQRRRTRARMRELFDFLSLILHTRSACWKQGLRRGSARVFCAYPLGLFALFPICSQVVSTHAPPPGSAPGGGYSRNPRMRRVCLLLLLLSLPALGRAQCPGTTTQLTPFATESLLIDGTVKGLTASIYKPSGVTPAMATIS